MSHNIPFDIQEKIMKLLPIKSLAQFRSVSKTLKSLIDSVKFIADYDNVCQPQRLLICYKPHKHLTSYDYILGVDDETFSRYKFPCQFPYLLIYSSLVGSSHGLFCFYGDRPYSREHTAFIWNPLMRKSIAIAVPSGWNTTDYEIVVGFGVCPLTIDPKIIMIRHYSMIDSACPHRQVKVFSLSSRAWRCASINLPRENMILEKPQVVIDGFIYWLADMRRTGCSISDYLIISFNLTSEEFKEIHLPESIESTILSISNLRETLVVLEYTMDRELYAVWMMDNYSFTQLYTINAAPTSLNTILGFRNNGAIIIERQGRYDVDNPYQRTLAIYEPDSKQITNIWVSGTQSTFSMHSYIETLLLIDEPDGTIYRHGGREKMMYF